MAFEAQDPEECLQETLDWARGRYTEAEIEAAMPLLRAYQYHCLDILLTTHELGEGYHSRKRTQIEKLIGKIDFDLGPDGEEQQ